MLSDAFRLKLPDLLGKGDEGPILHNNRAIGVGGCSRRRGGSPLPFIWQYGSSRHVSCNK